VEWNDFSVLNQNLVEYLFGTEVVLGVAVWLGFFLYYTMSGVPATVSIMALLPLLAAMGVAGWLGAQIWVVTLVVVLIGLVMGRFLLRVYTLR
jgi:hypothetical protein